MPTSTISNGSSQRDGASGSRQHTALDNLLRRELREAASLDRNATPRGGVDVDLNWPKRIAGGRMDTYHRWMEVALPVSMAGLPALWVPAGFGGAQQLPIGMQIIGSAHADLAVLQVGNAYERASPWIAQTLPPVLRA